MLWLPVAVWCPLWCTAFRTWPLWMRSACLLRLLCELLFAALEVDVVHAVGKGRSYR